ncbi:MAG: glycosyltransferase family 39 protein [Thermodesulfovibrionales bacterium]|nr:glycosyltransferase family 39 protein [Thermodesulfovibrionales bacterium]
MKNNKFEILPITFLIILTTLFALFVVNFNIPPFEDAAILMRYSEHVAQGKGIVWNVGEKPVDGATDFLFMLLVAFINRFGFSLENSVRMITIISHFLIVLLVYVGMRKIQGSGIGPALLTSIYLAVGPGLFFAAAYFGTPLFVLAIAAVWLIAQHIILTGKHSISTLIYLLLASLFVSLIRPEGVLIVIFITIAIGISIPPKTSLKFLALFGSLFFFLGGIYFIWRWNYFSYPLPNPFYKKGSGLLYFMSFWSSLKNSYYYAYPFIPAFILSIRNKRSLKICIAFSIVIMGTIGMWILISDEMNFGARFQYPVLILCALSWFPLVKSIGEEIGLLNFKMYPVKLRVAIILTTVFLFLFILKPYVLRSISITYGKDGRYDVGMILRDYANEKYTLATTEAGLIPLYSKWRALDTWGLNDQWIAHNGELTYKYLNEQKPDVIIWHEQFTPKHPPSPDLSNAPGRRGKWFRQVMIMKKYAECNKFILAAVFGVSPQHTHYYYIRSDLPESKEIIKRIRATKYSWWGGGEICENYAN